MVMYAVGNVVSYINMGQGIRDYHIAQSDSFATTTTFSATMANAFDNFDFMVEAYVAKPSEIIVKNTYSRKY